MIGIQITREAWEKEMLRGISHASRRVDYFVCSPKKKSTIKDWDQESLSSFFLLFCDTNEA